MRRSCLLDEEGPKIYDGGMVLDVVLKAVRRVWQKTSPPASEDDDEGLDPLNPFPDPVVIAFRDVIDLHSIPPQLVRQVVEGYLEEARAHDCPCVRIIHGKGIGVQRDIVRGVLSRTAFVVDFQDAPPEAGGWGATIATLQVKSKK